VVMFRPLTTSCANCNHCSEMRLIFCLNQVCCPILLVTQRLIFQVLNVAVILMIMLGSVTIILLSYYGLDTKI
jgi:hypothetical protein